MSNDHCNSTQTNTSPEKNIPQNKKESKPIIIKYPEPKEQNPPSSNNNYQYFTDDSYPI